MSINDAIDVDRDGNPLTYMDVISCDDDFAEELDLRMDRERLRRALVDALGERERRVIRMRYGLDGERALTQKEVAARLGISRSYVSRIEQAALDKLRAAFGTAK